MGVIFKQFLDSASCNTNSKVYCCIICNTHLSTTDDIISKAFQGQHGKAYLFNAVVNIFQGPAEERSMTTGLHTVRDIHCTYCQTVVGWRYVSDGFLTVLMHLVISVQFFESC
ncbi:hypothetical protein QVD99_003880 [Batrachochytrium dendrobatidis]|nr:hypothetical protein QVD99_003880 [Batrachochytrium dendrobatidis]